MKQRHSNSTRTLALALVLGSATLCTAPVWADTDEAGKLKALQQALQKPAEADEFAPKAIVFDQNEKAPAANAAPAAGAALNCSQLALDTQATAIDFEIQFKLGSADLSPVSEKTLNEIAKVLALAPERCVFVEGHTDVSGNADRNLRLSRDRANSVVQYIVGKAGVLRGRLISAGKGSAEPVKGLDPRDARNRRVSFKVAG